MTISSSNIIPLVKKKEPVPLTRKKEVQQHQGIVLTKVHKNKSSRRFVEVVLGDQSETNFFTGFSQDINQGGLFIATYNILNIGTNLLVKMFLTPQKTISLNAIVQWIREHHEDNEDVSPGMGVIFPNITAADQLAINHFMENNPPVYFDFD